MEEKWEAEVINLSELDRLEKVNRGWLEAKIACSSGQEQDSKTILSLVSEIRRLREALEFYKRDKHKNYAQWMDHVCYDWGEFAREALEGK